MNGIYKSGTTDKIRDLSSGWDGYILQTKATRHLVSESSRQDRNGYYASPVLMADTAIPYIVGICYTFE